MLDYRAIGDSNHHVVYRVIPGVVYNRKATLLSKNTPISAITDPADLVPRIESGDARAEERLIELYGRGIALLLDRHTNGAEEAQDLFQDTFRLAIEKLRRGELRDPVKLPGFLSRMARNLAIEHYRKAARRKTDADSETVGSKAQVGSTQLDRLLDSEAAGLVRQVIGDLANERDRQILYRFYIAEEDKEKISADFGLSSLQFNRVLHRARQRYKELYQSLKQRAVPAASLTHILLGAIPCALNALLMR